MSGFFAIALRVKKCRSIQEPDPEKFGYCFGAFQALSASLAAVGLSLAGSAFADPYCKPGLAAGQLALPTLSPRAKLDARQQRLLKFAPIVYLHGDEKHLPMRVEEFVSHKDTRWMKGTQEVLAAGKSTMAALYAQFQKGGLAQGITVTPGECAKAGSNPALNSRGGVLTTPIYATYVTQGGVDYLKYFFFYGYNGYYPLKVLGVKLKDNVGGDHWGDIERITVKLNRARTGIDEIFFAAHGGTDGQMIPQKLIQFEGSRPIVYSALNGHGSYPRAGLWIRVGGFANDITTRGRRWEPQVVQLFPQPAAAGNAFDPATMGWAYAPGPLGPDGIPAVGAKEWFLNPIEKSAYSPLQNWCADPADRICMIQKAGSRAVWQPILDEIQSAVGAKVVAPIRAAFETARDAVKAAGGKSTKAVTKAAASAGKAVTDAAKKASAALKGAGSKVTAGLKKLKFW